MGLVIWMIAPTVAVGALIHVPRLAAALARSWTRRRAPMAAPNRQPIERLAADLRRLQDRLTMVRADTDIPARAFRIRAAELAYAELLGAACQALELDDLVPKAFAGDRERDEVVMALSAAGLVLA